MQRPNGKITAVIIGAICTIGLGTAGWLYGRSAALAERVAVVETEQIATDKTLIRIDATLLRMDSKLRQLLEKP